MTTQCRCWDNDAALGHEGHCCFLRDDRDRKINNGFKEDVDICHVPERFNPWVITVAITQYAANRLPLDTKGWDGAPLASKDRRLYALRDIVGYQSWIDAGGWPITEAESNARLERIRKEELRKLQQISPALAQMFQEGRVS